MRSLLLLSTAILNDNNGCLQPFSGGIETIFCVHRLTDEFTALLRHLDNSDFISIDLQQDEHYFATVYDSKFSSFLVTKCFKEMVTLVQKSLLSSEHQGILVTGPKGVGKSLSLIALYSLLNSFINVVYVSDTAVNQIWMPDVQQYFNRAFKFTRSCVETASSLVVLFAEFIKKQSGASDTLILVDLNECSDENINEMKIISRICVQANNAGLCVILVISGGQGSNVAHFKLPLFDKFIPVCANYFFLPFTRCEVDKYLTKNSVQYNFDDELRHLTGFNPFFLKMAASATDLDDLEKKIFSFLRRFVEQNFKLPDNPATHPIFLRSIESVCKYFYMARNEIPLDNKHTFMESWVNLQGLCYIGDLDGAVGGGTVEETESKAIEIKFVMLNFPTIPDLIKEVIENLLKSNDLHVADEVKAIPQVQGYLLEQVFFDYLEKNHELSVWNETTEFTYKVDAVRSFEGRLENNTVYRLRLWHPAIDAIGKLRLSDDKYHIVFFQISRSAYAKHDAKISDLKCRKYRCKELKGHISSIFKYYKNLAKNVDECCYCYLSPTTVNTSPCAKLEEDARKYNIHYGILCTSSQLYQHFVPIL